MKGLTQPVFHGDVRLESVWNDAFSDIHAVYMNPPSSKLKGLRPDYLWVSYRVPKKGAFRRDGAGLKGVRTYIFVPNPKGALGIPPRNFR